MKKFLGIVCSLVLVIVAGLTFTACGKGVAEITISSSETEIDLVIGTDEQSKDVEFFVDNFGNGSGQVNFSVEENEKGVVSFETSYKGNGKTVLTITALRRGTARIVATSLQGSKKVVLTVRVTQPITGLDLKNEYVNKLYVIRGEELILSQDEIWKYTPSETNQTELEFSIIGNSQGCEIVDGKLVVGENCLLSSVTIKAVSAHNAEISEEFEVKILKPIEVIMQIDGKRVVDNVTSETTQILNFLEIFPRELDGSIYPNSKEVLLIVSAGTENETLNIKKIFSSEEEKFSVEQTAYSYSSATKLHIYKFLIQANSTEAGKIDSVVFDVSYDGFKAGNSDYSVNSVKLNINSYNKPLSVEVNGESGTTEVDVFENSVDFSNGKMIELSILPGNVKLSENNIIIWAEDFANLPISLYKLNATRTGYVCVFGFDQKGNPVGANEHGIRYASITSGTKLYAFINSNYNSILGTNKTAKIYAQASGFCNFTANSTARALTTINFVINPNAKNISLAEKDEEGVLTKVDSTTIFVEIGKEVEKYIAIDPNSFTIGSNSIIKIANGRIATIGNLVEFAVDKDYVYGKFTIQANKVGSSTITVILSDGKTKDFNLVVVSPLEKIEMDLEDVTFGGNVVESDVVPYKNITDVEVSVGETSPFIALNKLSIANSGGSGIQLVKTLTPSTAQYYLTYQFKDFTIPEGETLKTLTLDKVKELYGDDFDNIWGETSDILNTSRLSNLSILEAKNSGAQGNVLIKIAVFAMNSDGEYGTEPVGYFYYLVNFFIPVKGLTLTNGTLELYTYNTIGDKFVDKNGISKSISEFSVTVNPVNQGLTPTYLNSLEIYVNGASRLTNAIFEERDNVVYLSKGGQLVSGLEGAALKVTRIKDGNTFTFKVQAYNGAGNYIFALVLSEVNESKRFTAISRIVVSDAVEITDIDIVNASENDPIHFNNIIQSSGEEEAIKNPFELELISNIYGPAGKEITNSSLEFEIYWDKLSEKDYFINENGEKVQFATISEGKLTIKRGAYDFSEYFEKSEEEREELNKEDFKKFVQFGGEGYLKIYPTSNYYLSTNGWNGERPVVEIPVSVSDGKTISFYILSNEDFLLLGQFPTSSFELRANVNVPSDYVPVEEFSGTLTGGESRAFSIGAWCPLFKKITTTGVVENFYYMFESEEENTNEMLECVSVENETTYFGGLANINEGTIRNIGGTLEVSDGLNLNVSLTTLVNKRKGTLSNDILFLPVFKTGDQLNRNTTFDSVSQLIGGELVKYTGGLVGLNRGLIEEEKENVHYCAAVYGANVGGIAAVNEGTIRNTNFYGVAYGIETAGGIAALNSGIITNCDVLTMSLFNIGVYIASEKAYSYSETPIEFAVGGVAAKSNGGVILNCKVEASSDERFNPDIFESLIDVSKIDREVYCTVNGKPFGTGKYSSSFNINNKTFEIERKKYTIDDLTNPTKITYTQNGETVEIAVVDNKFMLGNAEFVISVDKVVGSANFVSRTIYAGGLVGILEGTGKIQESIFSGSLAVKQVASGGFVGKLVGDGNSSTTHVENCYAIVAYDESDLNLGISNGQFIGVGDLSEIKNSYISSNGTFGNAGQGTGNVVFSYFKRSSNEISKFLELSNIYAQNSSFSGDYSAIDLDYGLTLEDYLKISWADLYQNGQINYTVDTTGENAEIFGTITMSGLESDPTSTFNFSFSLDKMQNNEVEPVKFTYKNIEYDITIIDNSSYHCLRIEANGESSVDFTNDSFSTTWSNINFNKNLNNVVSESYDFRISDFVSSIAHATNSAYLPLNFNVEIAGEGYDRQIQPSVLDIVYAKTYFVWIYNNFDEIVSNEALSSLLGAGEESLTTEQYLCRIFGIDESLGRDEIKQQIGNIITTVVLPQLNSGFADLKTDIAGLKQNVTNLRPQIVNLINTISPSAAAIYDQQLAEIEVLIEKGIALTSLSEITLENISSFKLQLDYISGALNKFANLVMNTPIDGSEAIDEEIYTLCDGAFVKIFYASTINMNIGNFAHALTIVDLSFANSDMPTLLEGFKTAGWDIENINEESNSVWIYEDGKLPTLRNKELAKRISSFEVGVKENNDSWRSYVNAGKTSLVLFNYSVLGELTGNQQAILNNLNTISLESIFEFTNINGTDETASSNLFVIQSSNKSVVQIVGGKIHVVGTGEATLTITPLHKEFGLLNKVEKEITIYVINPLGKTEVFQGVSAKTDPINGQEISIYKNELNYITIATKTSISLGNQQFNFVTNAMGYEIKLKDNDIKALFGINGLNAGADADKFAEGTLTVKPNENVDTTKKYEFIVKALLQKENQKFNNVLYLKTFINEVNEILSQVESDADFEAGILIKAEKVLISVKDAEIDPSSMVSVDFELQTTNTDDKLIIVIRDENNNVIWVSEDVTIDGLKYYKDNNSNLFEINPTIGEYSSGRKNGTVLISIDESKRSNVVKTSTYTVTFSDSSLEKSSQLTLKLKPQEILNVTYVHNNRTEDSTENGMKLQAEPSSVLMPGDCGLLTIGLYPTYSNFKRIVLTSQIVDGQNYILLEQMYNSGEYYIPVSLTTGYSSVRDGNVLTINKPSDPSLLSSGNIYVRTKMLDTVSEGIYFPINITIICEDENGNEYVSKSETITLLSETIDGAQITVNGGKDATLTRGNTFPIKVSVNQNQSLATVTPVNFKNGESKYDFVSTYFNTAEYEIVDGRKVYSGTITIGLDAEIEDDGVFKLQTVVNKVINGKYETAIDSVEIRVVDFLVEGIKIKGNADDDNVFNTPAAIEKELEFEFVLSKTPEAIESDQEKSIARINNAKEEFVKSVSLKQYFNENQQFVINTDRNFVVNGEHEGDKTVPSHLSNTNSSLAYDLFFTSDMTQYINNLTGEVQESKYFNIKYNGDKNGNSMSSTMLKITGKSVGSVGMTIKIGYRVPGLDYDQYVLYNFVINVQIYSDEDKPTPIENGEQFVEYLSAGEAQYSSTNFILMNNIVLENFVPFERTNFSSLDGNNKVITIKNFSIENGTSVNLGLFTNVGSDATIKNLVVNYGQLSNIVLPSNVRNFNFGGIAVTNNGTIYNCEVVSLDLENNSPSSNGGIKVVFGEEGKSKADNVSSNIAGLVVTNNSSITNSRVGAKTFHRQKDSRTNKYVSKLDQFKQISYENDNVITTLYNYGEFNIVGQGNMSGFAINNSGVISASYFANGKIVNETASGALSETAGFVISNSLGGTIFGSFVEGIKLDTDVSVNITGGGIVAQGICAGFAYQNFGSISDCYTNIRLAGESTGRIVSGFVYNNESSGIVERCLSASTIVGQLTTQMPFSGKNARDEIMQKSDEGLNNCYYLVKKQDTESVLEEKYKTGAIALQISTLQSGSFYGFALTTENNGNDGVWSWDGILPQLVSANQKAISVRRVIENYSSLVSSGVSSENLNVYPYISGYEYGTKNNPIIIRSADEFNRVFGQETALIKNAYYAISQFYNKNLGIVFGSYRLVASIDFDKLTYVENVKISSSIMDLAKNSSNSGSFDGNALTISNIEISLDNQNSVGLFSKITSGGVFKNVNLTVKSIATGNSGIYAGAVAGYVSNSSLANITVQPVNETGETRSKISGQNIVGGVVGAVVGNSTVSNLTSSISVISGNAQAKTGIDDYILNVLRNSATVINGVVSDKNKDYSFAGGVVGILDIYDDINDQSVVTSTPNAKQLTFIGSDVSVQGSVVGSVVGYNGASTYLVDCAFILEGNEETLNQRLITYANILGGIVGVNKGDLYELRIEHSSEVQKAIEDNLQNYYNNSNEVFRGNTKLFNSTGTSSADGIYAGGLVGKMLGGELTVAYSRVDVSLQNAVYVGGAIGYVGSKLDLIEVYAFGDVDGINAGGLIGRADANVSFERCVAMNFISKTNLNFVAALNAANEFNAQGEEGGQWQLSVDKTTISNGDVTYSVRISDGKVVEIQIKNLMPLIAENGSYESSLTDEVYANEEITYMNMKLTFKKDKGLLGLSLDGGLSSYRGYELDSSVINKMFLGAGWDASLWELKDGRILPSFSYGVSAKTIYIEKPTDLLKLKKYYRGDNIIIFGDDPTTSFNPYEFVDGDKSTYGTFTLNELQGLTVDKETQTITFDISVIKSLVSVGDNGTFFRRFLGVMYGEFGRTPDSNGLTWTYKIIKIENPLFDTVKGGSISDLTFDNRELGTTITTPVLANTIESRADLNNLSFENIKISTSNPKQIGENEYAIGIVAARMSDVLSISNVKIQKCEIQIKDLGSKKLSVGAIAGKNVVENATSKFNGVKVSELITNSNLTLSDGLNVGGFFGETSGTFEFKESQVTDSTFNVGLTSAGSFDGAQVIFVGGFVGNAQGNNTVHKLTDDAQLTSDLTISVEEAATTYAGLLFGRVGGLIYTDNSSVTFSGTIQNAGQNEEDKKSTTLVVGGAAGLAGGAEIAGMNAKLTATGLKTKSFTTNGSTVISSFGSLFGMLTGNTGIKKTKYFENISITGGEDSSENNQNAFAAGGLIGVVNGGMGNNVTIENSGYYGELTVDYSAKTLYVGGLVGFSNSNIAFSGVEFAKTEDKCGKISIKNIGQNVYVGGIIGFSAEKNTTTTIENSIATGEIVFPETKSGKAETTGSAETKAVNVGLLAGSIRNGKISNNKVGGNISFNDKADEWNIIAGGLVGSLNNGTVSGNYAWGNITLMNASGMLSKPLTAGGLVGTTGASGESANMPKFSSNYSLTSLYITKTAEMANTNIGALVGTGAISNDSKDNYYCHQINLATDTYGTNLYYKRGSSILSKLGSLLNSLGDDLKGEGSKLNPIRYQNGNLEEGTYYYLGSNVTLSSPTSDPSTGVVSSVSDLKGHLVGDGYKIIVSVTPFGTIHKSGAVSGVSFVTTSQVVARSAGRVQPNDFREPSGIAETNYGVIFAVVVEARGYATSSYYGDVVCAFNSGIAWHNYGLIADSGVIYNVKSVYAGISQENSGVVRNSYTTGAVHHGATYALVKGSSGIIMNCYTALDAANIATANTIENVYYDIDAGNPTATAGTGKSTDDLSTQIASTVTTILKEKIKDSENNEKVNTEKLNGANWTQDYRVNFGYPYLGIGVYQSFSYMKKYTGGNEATSDEINNIKNQTEKIYGNGEVKLIKVENSLSRNPIMGTYSWELTKYRVETEGFKYDYNYVWVGIAYRNNSFYEYAYAVGNSAPFTWNSVYTNSSGTLPINSSEEFEELGIKITVKWNTTFNISDLVDKNTRRYVDSATNTAVPTFTTKDSNSLIEIPNAGKLAQLQTSNDDGNKSYLNYDYQLLCNIDLSKVDDLSSWTPIGNNTNKFSGTFDGNNYVIYNIPSILVTEKYAGFFGVSEGTIKNCSFIYKAGTTIEATDSSSGKENPAGVVGYNGKSGSIDNVSTSGALILGIYAGGIVSDNYGGIYNSHNYSTISSEKGSAGGIASVNYGTISGCNNYANVYGGLGNAGGIAGYQKENASNILSCLNYGVVSGQNAGGIVGCQSGSSVLKCQNYGAIVGNSSAGESNVGGIVGLYQKTLKELSCLSWPAKQPNGGPYVVKISQDLIDADGVTLFKLEIMIQDKAILSSTGNKFVAKKFEYKGSSGNKEGMIIDNEGNNYKFYFTWKSYKTAEGDWGYFYGNYSYNLAIYRIGTQTSVRDSFNSGEITGTYAGGIVGRLQGHAAIENCKNQGKISSTSFAGGIVGGTNPGGNANLGKILNCSSITSESETQISGAFSANIGNDIAFISNCYGIGKVSNVVDDGRNGDSSTDQSGVTNKSNNYKWTSSTSKPTLNNGKYYVYTAQELAWIAAQGTICYDRVEIMNDINLAGKVWDITMVTSKTYRYDKALSYNTSWVVNDFDKQIKITNIDNKTGKLRITVGTESTTTSDFIGYGVGYTVGGYTITLNGTTGFTVRTGTVNQNNYKIFNSNGAKIYQ